MSVEGRQGKARKGKGEDMEEGGSDLVKEKGMGCRQGQGQGRRRKEE